MPKQIISSNDTYDLYLESSKKRLCLVHKQTTVTVLKAYFFYDSADGTCLLSDFKYVFKHIDLKDLAKITADLVSDYLKRVHDKSKLFCFPGKAQAEFESSKEYRSSEIERLMIRDDRVFQQKFKTPSGIGIRFKFPDRDARLNDSDYLQIVNLLKQTYWGSNADIDYVKKALSNSIFYIAVDISKNRIVGVARYVSNTHFAYISDLVVDEHYRKKGIGTALMYNLLQVLDDDHLFSLLISAKDGDGKEAAPKLYGEKFGFMGYDMSHTSKKVYFRYIDMKPESKPEPKPEIPRSTETHFFAQGLPGTKGRSYGSCDISAGISLAKK